MSDLPDTPELDRRTVALEPEPVNETLTRFVDWLREDGLVLARYGERYDVRLPCPECCIGTEGHLRKRVRGKVPGCAGLEISKLTARDKQVLSTLEGVTEYKNELLRRFPCRRCHGDCFIYEERVRDGVLCESHEPYERLFARFLGLDEDLMEQERRALLEHLRERDGQPA